MLTIIFFSAFTIFLIIYAIIEFYKFFKKTKISNDEKRTLRGLIWMLITTSISTITILTTIFNETQPKAIDVYRGDTELSIRKEMVNDSIVKIDTNIIFKDKNIWKSNRQK